MLTTPRLITRCRLLTALTIVMALAGCASLSEELDYKNWPVERLYQEAKSALDDGRYETAIQHYETLEAQYPFGPYAEQAILDSAYAYWKFSEPDTAIATAERFIKLYPRHAQVDYAYYLRGLASEGKKKHSFGFDATQNASLRDPGTSHMTYEYFAELVARFPHSRYTPDAQQRLGHIRNSLAEYELFVANYYLDKGAYVAAAGRAKYILENFPQTPSRQGALATLNQAYAQLGLDDLAADVGRVQQLNGGATANSPE